MIAKIKDLGTWSRYVPESMPGWVGHVPPGYAVYFARRDSDGLDWYAFRAAEGSFTEGCLLAMAYPGSQGETVQATVRDRGNAPVPTGMRVLEIEDVDPDNAAPWKAYEQRIYDPATQTIGDLPEPVVLAVRDYQFAGQAAAEEIITDDAAMAWVATGKTPDTLIAAVKAKVTDPDRQKRVLLFLAGTTSFPIGHELTPLLAASFGKDTPEKLKAFFRAASQR
ncbi:hypothetical protein [Methylobacterium sp. CM6246]